MQSAQSQVHVYNSISHYFSNYKNKSARIHRYIARNIFSKIVHFDMIIFRLMKCAQYALQRQLLFSGQQYFPLPSVRIGQRAGISIHQKTRFRSDRTAG